MITTFATNTHIAPIVDVSTYEGPFSYESLWQGDEVASRNEDRVVCWNYDSEKMGRRIVEEANKVFEAEKPLSQYGVVSIKATKFGSPREYNFMTDWLDLEVEVDNSFWQLAKEAILKPENRAAIVGYAGDRWVSYDGFRSSMLNRISDLSRDYWRHRHYGTHMATDKEVEDALLADLEDAFAGLYDGSSEDEFREFGAILALLWLIEYPGDFARDDNAPIWGSWVTNEMIESLQGNSSLSEFCTVLDEDEIKERFGRSIVDFGARRAEFADGLDRYLKCFGDNPGRIGRICEFVGRKMDKLFRELESRQFDVVANHATDDRSRDWLVLDRLDDFRQEADARLKDAEMIRLWRDAYHEVQ